MTVAKIILSIINLISFIMREYARRELIDEGKKKAYDEAEVRMRKSIERAFEAGNAQRDSDAGIDDARSLPDDGYRRD